MKEIHVEPCYKCGGRGYAHDERDFKDPPRIYVCEACVRRTKGGKGA